MNAFIMIEITPPFAIFLTIPLLRRTGLLSLHEYEHIHFLGGRPILSFHFPSGGYTYNTRQPDSINHIVNEVKMYIWVNTCGRRSCSKWLGLVCHFRDNTVTPMAAEAAWRVDSCGFKAGFTGDDFTPQHYLWITKSNCQKITHTKNLTLYTLVWSCLQ